MAALYFLQKCLKSSAKRPLTLWSAMTMVMHCVWFSPLCSHFCGTIYWCLASKAKINFFWNVFEWSSPKKGQPEEWNFFPKNVDFSLWCNRRLAKKTFKRHFQVRVNSSKSHIVLCYAVESTTWQTVCTVYVCAAYQHVQFFT